MRWPPYSSFGGIVPGQLLPTWMLVETLPLIIMSGKLNSPTRKPPRRQPVLRLFLARFIVLPGACEFEFPPFVRQVTPSVEWPDEAGQGGPAGIPPSSVAAAPRTFEPAFHLALSLTGRAVPFIPPITTWPREVPKRSCGTIPASAAFLSAADCLFQKTSWPGPRVAPLALVEAMGVRSSARPRSA